MFTDYILFWGLVITVAWLVIADIEFHGSEPRVSDLTVFVTILPIFIGGTMIVIGFWFSVLIRTFGP